MIVLNVFTTGFSFFYSSSQAGTVTVFDGLNGTGNVLATIPVVNQFNSCGLPGDPTGTFACWTPVGVTFSGTAFSVNFGGVANQTGFDEITLGSSTPGNAAPVAMCQDITVEADGDCLGTATAADVDFGSFDPNGDPLTLTLDPPGPYELGDTAVTLTVTDDIDGATRIGAWDIGADEAISGSLTPKIVSWREIAPQ